jgi:DNA-binding transcriptional ArsR family regulator
LPDDPELRRLLWYLLGGARGGENRALIIHQLNLRPMNLNQLADALGVDYRTIMHHADVLKGNSLVVSEGERYGAMYYLSPRLESGMYIFREICGKLRFKLDVGIGSTSTDRSME